MMYIVTRTRKEWSDDRGHQHIEGVCTATNTHYTRKQVVDSMNSGDLWVTTAAGKTATIKPMRYCPAPGCLATPYITTHPDHTSENNLDNLPAC